MDELVGLCTPGSGVACVVLGPYEAAGDTIELTGAHQARWDPPGVTFSPHLTPLASVDLLTPDLDDEAEIAVTAVQPGDGPPSGGGGWDVLVRVVGEVVVDGAAVSLTDAETELLAVLALLGGRDGVNVDRLATLVASDPWRTPKVRSVQARVSHLRAKLGVGRDGERLVPDTRTAAAGGAATGSRAA